MGLFDFMRGPDVNQGVAEWEKTQGAVLIDVRTREEYRQGHIPGSVNIPLNEITSVTERVPAKDTPIFVHCLSGGRSAQAAGYLGKLGYRQVKNIGGISGYQGKTEV